MIIHYHHNIYTIEEIENETKEINLDRGYTIVKLIETHGMDLNKATLYANYYIYSKYHGCIYSDKIRHTLKSLE